MDTLMCPVLVGIKPHDIIFIPSLTGKFMEDWKVTSVGYTQNDGRINVSVQASRIFGNASPMNKPAYDKFLNFAKQQGLVGENATLEAWDLYAWGSSASAQSTEPTFAASDRTSATLSGTGLLRGNRLSPGGLF
jgi:hypothetical protein